MKKLTILILLIMLVFTNAAIAKKEKQTDNDKQVGYLNIQWWDEFNDQNLHDYMLILFKNNHDFKIAQLRIKEGEQIVKQSLANELPQIGLSGNVERILRASDQYFGPNMLIPNFSQTNLLFPISASYEIDIWGANRTRTKSIQKQLEMVQQEERAKYISISGDFAAAYYNLVKCDKILKIQNELVDLQKNIVNLTQIKYNAGKCSIDDLIEQKKILKNFEEQYNTINKDRKLVEEEIKYALSDSSIEEIPDSSQSYIPKISFPDQISSEIIENRPDVIVALKKLEHMGLDVKVAKKELLPRFILFGQFGFNAYRLSNLFNNNAILSSFGVAPILDIFTGGRKVAYLRYKKYKYDEALENYKQTALNAYKEVNDTLVCAKIYSKNLQSAKERLELEKKNYNIAFTRYENGKGTLPHLYEAKERELLVEKNIVESDINTLIAIISLYKSTGGKNLKEISENI